MFRVVLLLMLSIALPTVAQDVPELDHSAVFNFTQADSESVAIPAPTAVASQTIVAEAAIAPISASSSRPLMEPALVQASNAMLLEPVVANSTRKLPEGPSVKQQRAWWALTLAQHGAATFDAWSTRQSLTSGNGYERNPLLKPFAGSSALYPVMQVLPLGLDYLSKRMMRSQHGIFRKTWWVPQTIATAGFVWSGAHNLRVANLR